MNTDRHALLFVEDDVGLQRQLRWSFSEFDVSFAGDRATALKCIKSARPPVIVVDLGLPPDPHGASEGLAVLESIQREAPHTKVIMLTANGDRENAIQSISLGAYDYCQKPIDLDTLKLIIGRARHVQLLEEESRRNREAAQLSPLPDLVTCCSAMLRVCRNIEKIAPSDLTVLLVGESGTGKEVLARALHKLSLRSGKPFVPINCSAIPDTLLESELFGHERGAFTGAVKQTLGKIEVAQHGTIFLDEIGDVPLALQVKLLRFLQERVIERVGGRKEIPVDVRVICATNHDLPEMVRGGRFREDLFYRLNEVIVRIPPLRERGSDSLVLAHHFLNQFRAQHSRAVRGFTPDARKLIASYAWPGNVRELQSQVRRALLMTEHNVIGAADLDIPHDPGTANPAENWPGTLREARQSAEQQAVKAALAAADGNISEAARFLGISRPTLYDLTRTHGLRTAVDQTAHNQGSTWNATANTDEHDSPPLVS